MSSQLRFEGSSWVGPTDIVLAVESKLNWQGVQAEGPADRVASGDCVQGVNCPANIGYRQVSANFGGYQGLEFESFVTTSLLLLVALVAFFVGLIIGIIATRTQNSPG